MAVPKVKVFETTINAMALERSIDTFICANGIEAEDIISVSFSNGDHNSYAALMVYKV